MYFSLIFNIAVSFVRQVQKTLWDNLNFKKYEIGTSLKL